MDQTETMCVLAGAAAIGAIWYTTSKDRGGRLPLRSAPTECSARVAGTSAKLAVVGGDGEAAPVGGETSSVEFWDAAWSQDAEVHMKKHSDAVRRLTPAEIVRRQRIQPVMPMDTTFAKSLGSAVPTVGRAVQDDKPRSISGNCGLFYASEAYSDALQTQQTTVVEDPDPLDQFLEGM